MTSGKISPGRGLTLSIVALLSFAACGGAGVSSEAPPDSGAQLCRAHTDLFGLAQETAQLSQALLDFQSGVSRVVTPVQVADRSHVVETAVLAVIPVLDAAAFPLDPDLLVSLRQEAAGLLQASRGLQQSAIGTGATDPAEGFVSARDGLASAVDGYATATTEVNRLDAAGTLNCP
jgi:hypothetical protein